MSTSIQTETTESSAAFTRLERMRKLEGTEGFVWFKDKLKALESDAMETILAKSTTPEKRQEALTRYWLLHEEIARIVPDELKLASKACEKAANPPPTP